MNWITKRPRPYLLALLSEACSRTGQIAQALSGLAEAFAETARDGELWWEAELHRLQGETLLLQGLQQASAAEACFQQARRIAVAQQAKSLELRAAISLSRLWQQQGQYERAMQLLAPCYTWFTEGFETADLLAARVLFEALGSQP